MTTTFPAPYEYLQGVLLQNLQLAGLPAQITIGGTIYPLRSHLHTTLLAVKRIAPQLVESRGLTPEAAEQLILQQLSEALKNFQPRLERYLPELRIVTVPAGGRQTIIIRCQVQDLAEFFIELSRRLQLELPLQPSHVTLYAVNDLPIGINSEAEMERISHPLSATELREWQEAISTQEIFGITL